MRHLLFGLGLFGLFTSTVYSALVVAAVRRFGRRREEEGEAAVLPPVSLLKPLHGAEPNLAAHLEGFFQQTYPAYELIFCARTANDAGLEIARRVALGHPGVQARFVTSGQPPYANAKIASLARMREVAQYDILVVSDSDVRVEPGYLRAVVAPFADPEVGLVTCVYRGVATAEDTPRFRAPSSLWSQLEGIGMSVEMTAGVLVAEMMEGMQFALGPTMAMRTMCVDEIGGFAALGEYCADDFLLGNLIAAKGHTVVLSHHVIDHIILNAGFADSIRHQVRWMKSTRFSRPKGHFGTGLTFSLPFGLLTFAAALSLHRPWWAAAALCWSVLNRALLAAFVGAGVVRERHLLRTVLLYPLRDLMGFCFWAASYGSSTIIWRGERYVLEAGGRMRRSGGPPPGSAEERSSAFTV